MISLMVTCTITVKLTTNKKESTKGHRDCFCSTCKYFLRNKAQNFHKIKQNHEKGYFFHLSVSYFLIKYDT